MESVTIRSQMEVGILKDGRKLRVVDTPGVGDTRGTTEQGEQLFMYAIRDAIVSNPAGYHALLIVLRFGSRFTQEDINTMSYLKKVFGQNFIKKHCIVVMSWGDHFRDSVKDGDINVSFPEWCKQQTGSIKTLFQEVQERVVLFNNRGNQEEKNEQRRVLIAMIDRLMLGGRRYTDAKFEKASMELEKLKLEQKISVMGEEIQEETSLILLEKDRIKSYRDPNHQMFAMRSLMGRLRQLLTKIDHEKVQTMDLVRLRTVVVEAQHQIEQEMTVLRLKKEMAEKNKADTDEHAKKMREMELQLAELKLQAERDSAELNTIYTAMRDALNQERGKSIWRKMKDWFESLF